MDEEVKLVESLGRGVIGTQVINQPPKQYSSVMEDLATVENKQTPININNESPEFIGTDKEDNIGNSKEFKSAIVHCKSCGDECTNVNIDGECLNCALRKLRTLETKLSQFHKIKQEHEYCGIDGHGEVYKNKLHPEWEGKFIINGIELYPVYPLCKECIDTLTAYFVYFLEERGILRKGSDHVDSKWGDPYKMPLKTLEKQMHLKHLSEFIASINLYVKDKSSPVNTLLNSIKQRYKILLQMESKGVKEWEKSKKVQLPQNQLELLKLVEKYSPLLQNNPEATRSIQEKQFLKTQEIPLPLKSLVEKCLLLLLQNKEVLGKLQESLVVMQQQNLDPEKEKLNLRLLKNLVASDLPILLVEMTNEALGIQFANSAEDLLNEILGKYTLSSLIVKLTTEQLEHEK